MDLTQLMPNVAVLMLAGAAFALYIASRLGVFALQPAALGGGAGSIDPAGIGGATLAQWLPIATIAILALRHAPDVSVSIIFASSVACMTLVLGATLFSSAAPAAAQLESPHRRAWGMVLPAAVLALMAGFAAQFNLKHAAIFAVQGVVALLMWTAARRELPAAAAGGGASDGASGGSELPPFASVAPIQLPSRKGSDARRASQTSRGLSLIAWLVLTLIGAQIALRATDGLTHEISRLSGGMIAAVMIAPAVVLPMIGSSLNWAHEGQTGAAVSCAAGCTLLNLCVLLPVVIVIGRLTSAWERTGADALIRGTWLDAPDPPLEFPMAVWRVDTVLLIVTGAMLLVFSTGRWIPRRLEGLLLLLAYGGYIWANGKVGR